MHQIATLGMRAQAPLLHAHTKIGHDLCESESENVSLGKVDRLYFEVRNARDNQNYHPNAMKPLKLSDCIN